MVVKKGYLYANYSGLERRSIFLKKTYHRPVLTEQICLQMIQAAVAKAKELDIRVNVAVMDSGANLKAFIRMDEAPLLSETIAKNKAYTAAAFGLATDEWYSLIKDDPSLLNGIVHTERLVVFGGGLPIKSEGYLVGGIGVSGGSVDEDIQCAQAALDLFNK